MLPPENPPPPFPRNLPSQVVAGRPMKTLPRPPDGGCVTVAVTRHEPSDDSTAAELIVGLGSETLARPSHGHTGEASGKSGFGGVSAAPTKAIGSERKRRVIR